MLELSEEAAMSAWLRCHTALWKKFSPTTKGWNVHIGGSENHTVLLRTIILVSFKDCTEIPSQRLAILAQLPRIVCFLGLNKIALKQFLNPGIHLRLRRLFARSEGSGDRCCLVHSNEDLRSGRWGNI
jgi:hypothetical protein